MEDSHISLAHGNGGRFMRELIEDIFARHLSNQPGVHPQRVRAAALGADRAVVCGGWCRQAYGDGAAGVVGGAEAGRRLCGGRRAVCAAWRHVVGGGWPLCVAHGLGRVMIDAIRMPLAALCACVC